MTTITTQSAFGGCLLGGAVGDALGAYTEFMSLADILRKHGPDGVTSYQPCYGGIGKFTDDTQMSLFTAEGLLRAYVAEIKTGTPRYETLGGTALQRWYKTQGGVNKAVKADDRGLVWLESLHSRRAPGNTCLSSLKAMSYPGQPADNDSKGCGAVMRMAPVGLFAWSTGYQDTFFLANQLGALTHGHPTGFLSGGALAVILQQLLTGKSLPDTIGVAVEWLEMTPDSTETLAAIELALELADSDMPTRKAIKQQGEGWIAEEALGIALYCALTAADFREGIINAINHDGDTDSSGSICGNILGIIHGVEGIPEEWLEPLELREVIESVADDLHDCGEWGRAMAKYPGY